MQCYDKKRICGTICRTDKEKRDEEDEGCKYKRICRHAQGTDRRRKRSQYDDIWKQYGTVFDSCKGYDIF